MNILGFVDSQQATNGRQQIDQSGWFVLHATPGDGAGPVEDPRNANAAFIIRSLDAAQMADAIGSITAVVGRVDNQRVFGRIHLFQFFQQSRDGPVCVVNRAGVDRGWIIQLAVTRNDFIRRRNRGMRLVEPDVQEERLVAIARFIQPRDCFVHHNLTGVAIGLPDRRAIADEVDRVFMAGLSVIGCGKPIVETVIRWSWLVRLLRRRHAQMPFAQVHGFVAMALEHFCQRHFTFQQVRILFGVVDPTVDARAQVLSSGQQCRAGRRADRGAGIESP